MLSDFGNFGSDDFDDLFVRFEVDGCGKVNYEDFNRLVRKEYHASLKANRAAVKGPEQVEKKAPKRPWRRAAENFALSEEPGPPRPGQPQPLHNVRKREVIRLLRHFSQQHDAHICRVRSFAQLLRLEYPKASAEEHKLMLDLVPLMTRSLEPQPAPAPAPSPSPSPSPSPWS